METKWSLKAAPLPSLVTAKKNGMYQIHDTAKACIAAETKTISLKDLHEKLGHSHHESLRTMSRLGYLEGYQLKDDKSFECEACIQWKLAEDNIPKSSESKVTEVGQMIHTDVWGPAKFISSNGNRYFITFIDKFSHHTTVMDMKHKNEVLDAFKRYYKMFKNQVGKKIRQFDRIMEESILGHFESFWTRRVSVTFVPFHTPLGKMVLWRE
jgi:hypothetical protein